MFATALHETIEVFPGSNPFHITEVAGICVKILFYFLWDTIFVLVGLNCTETVYAFSCSAESAVLHEH